MSQITAGGHSHGVGADHPALRSSNISMAPGAGTGLKSAFIGLGVLGLAVVAIGWFKDSTHALAALHVGVITAITICLGATFFVLIFNLVNAGWVSTFKRQYENVMSLLPIVSLLMIPVFVLDYLKGGVLFTWMSAAAHGDVILEKKAGFLNPMFFYARSAFYILLWAYITSTLRRLSLEQDRTGDKWLTAKARRTSAWAILVMALSTAFAGFDWLMSIDFKFFSTMWGVYFFSGSAYVGTATLILILALLRRAGKMEGAVTSEHFHDLGKLLFSFTVFWAYIAFSQYFLIWYSGIPEETAFFEMRQQGAWPMVGLAVIISHFALPFVIMLFRGIKRNPTTIAFFAIWSIAAHVIDMFWVVRPVVHVSNPADPVGWGMIWIDVGAVLGVLGVLGWLIVGKVTSGPLVGVNDPRLGESLEHRNYV
ncbi:MAG: hypothetical protein U0638_04545 [Phycisphaerales bacterium]